ncbi:MAG: hypothetical protein ACOX2Q_12490 [Dehalobacterium sp.]|jgi:hypothetical protein
MMYSKEEMKLFVDGMKEGKTYSEILDELYPKSEYDGLYDCVLENMRSISLVDVVKSLLTKKELPALRPCVDCIS